MQINFGTNAVNCTIAFDWRESANYSGVANTVVNVRGSSFNGKLFFPYGITGINLASLSVLNKHVEIPNSVTNMASAFSSCYVFNQPVNIPNSVTNMSYTFNSCFRFNQLINIPNSVTTMASTFNGCTNFNQPINIPNSVTSMSYTFGSCFKFNQLINIPNSVTNLTYTFNGCIKFNQPINIPNGVTNMASTFYKCSNFNQPINIPNSVTNLTYTFNGCYNFNQLLIEEYAAPLNVNMLAIFNGKASGTWKNTVLEIFTGHNVAEYMINQKLVDSSTILNFVALSSGNGYYNDTANIYIYNNAG